MDGGGVICICHGAYLDLISSDFIIGGPLGLGLCG
jgi:hypothetical protein